LQRSLFPVQSDAAVHPKSRAGNVYGGMMEPGFNSAKAAPEGYKALVALEKYL
jgi:hypothetical protein